MSFRQLVLVGDGEFAEIAYEYFTHDSQYQVVAFAVERAFITRAEFLGLPVIAVEELTEKYSAESVEVFVAITNTHLNRVRARLCKHVKGLGYRLATYVSSRAFVWHNVRMGENCFVFENNVIQYHVQIGNGVVLWSGNHIGHRTRIGDYCFLTSHVVVSGYCDIGENCFLGVNASIADNTVVAKDCIIGMGSVIVRPTEAGKVYVGNPAKPLEKSAYVTFKVPEDQI